MPTAEHLWLILWLIVWVIVICLTIRDQWSQKIPSVGLPLIYLLSLSLIHWFGALIYAFPWYAPTAAYLINASASLQNVAIGFEQSAYGVISFGIGSSIIAPWILKLLKPRWLYEIARQPNLNIFKVYILLGFVFYLLIAPISLSIPGFSALTTSGVALFIVGLCLACWQAWCFAKTRSLFVWLMVACSMPLITTLTLGFIGYGSVASLVVLMFVFNFYRPRWQVIVTGIFVLIFGLSVFVTYLRDRSEIRTTVWGGQGVQTRIEQLWQTVSQFEFFDPFKQEHLEAIDTRLNQNVLVGQAVSHISAGLVDYAHGETLEQAVLAAIPRLLWPNKPVFAGSPQVVSRYTGRKFAMGTSVGVGQVLEFYINFGSWGVVLGFLIYGTLLRVIDISAGQKLISGNWVGFTAWFLPGLGLIQPGGSLVEVVASTLASVVLVNLINRIYLAKISQRGLLLPEMQYDYDQFPSHFTHHSKKGQR